MAEKDRKGYTGYVPKGFNPEAEAWKPNSGMLDPLADDQEQRAHQELIDYKAELARRKDEPPPVPAAPPWPVLSPDAYHGLAGEIVRAIEPETEADPAAVLVQMLAAFGNAVGKLPYFLVEGTRHHGNLFVVVVGNSAKGRKGTSWGRVREVMEAAVPSWFADCVANGLVSGEGLINEVRDAKGDDPGVCDKRLLIVESEFASVLKANGRDGSTLSPILRQAWDGGPLRTMAKTAPARATDAHISLVGHIVESELRRSMKGTDSTNGFANRILWIAARRSKLLPNGGKPFGAARLCVAMQKAIAQARSFKEIGWTEAGNALWCHLYNGELNEERPGSVYETITARAPAQTRRLAMVYAMLDGQDRIDVPHLEAALAVWRYADATAARVFPESPAGPLATKIHTALKQKPAGMIRSEITLAMKNVAKADDIQPALQELFVLRMARCSTDESNGGRKAERWFAAG